MIAALALLLAAGSYPDGAPWGHAGAPQTASCASCHWDNDPETGSARISLDGLPGRFVAGERYSLIVRLADAGAVNGFQLVASHGRFEPGSAGSEAQGTSVRSIVPGGAWPIVWIADDAHEPVRFWLAVMDANGDASSYGDRVLLNTFESLP
ncbi:choice-of-anchor V domain-containing protein [Hyphobacterium sp.]|uniref:choice-of-anchor V domain-containing protein n=1 Tax=Hyphobacterium sp. TaxID=2004662 RepID=UPI003B51F7A6